MTIGRTQASLLHFRQIERQQRLYVASTMAERGIKLEKLVIQEKRESDAKRLALIEAQAIEQLRIAEVSIRSRITSFIHL
jgi:DNA-binding protein H-NS